MGNEVRKRKLQRREKREIRSISRAMHASLQVAPCSPSAREKLGGLGAGPVAVETGAGGGGSTGR